MVGLTTILVVDDHDEFRATAAALLHAGGFDVIGQADTGAGALAATRTLAPDVVLLDIRLPDLDGFAVSRLIRIHAPTTRVVLCSARDALDYGSRTHECGATGFITKADLSVPVLTALLHTDRR